MLSVEKHFKNFSGVLENEKKNRLDMINLLKLQRGNFCWFSSIYRIDAIKFHETFSLAIWIKFHLLISSSLITRTPLYCEKSTTGVAGFYLHECTHYKRGCTWTHREGVLCVPHSACVCVHRNLWDRGAVHSLGAINLVRGAFGFYTEGDNPLLYPD